MKQMDTIERIESTHNQLVEESILGWKDFQLEAYTLGTAEGVTFEKEILPEAAEAYTIPASEFNRWPAGLLAEYIYHVHHCYYFNEEPTLSHLLEKAMELHSTADPGLQKVATLWHTFKNQFSNHLVREERVLFEHIRHLSIARSNNTFLMPTGIQKIEAVIRDMRGDHNVAASILDEIRVVTSNYTYAYNQSNCLDTLYRKLKSFDSRFRLDIHVENNILFPKAALLERELVKLKLL